MRPLQRRAESRLKVTIRARIRDGREDRDVCLLDLSSRGLLATTVKPPARGEFVEILLGPVSLVGHVKWSSQHRFGVALRERIDPAAIAAGQLERYSERLHVGVPRRIEARVASAALQGRRVAQAINLLLVLGLCVGVAVGLASAVSEGLGAFAKAGNALASSREAYQSTR